MTIVEFLEARLSEDEAEIARRVASGWNTRRRLREVAAKQAILARCVEWLSYGPMKDWEEVDAQPAFALWKEVAPDLLRDLASVYADHPDFDPAWALARTAV